MGLLWRKGDSKYHKIISACIAIPAVPTLIHILFIRSFLPNEKTYYIALYISIGLTISFILLLSFFVSTNRWKPTKAWYNFNRKKKAGLYIIGISLLFIETWVTVGYFIPYLYTTVIYEKSINIIVTQKHTRTGIIGDCRYSLSNERMKRILFQICINSNFYKQLPDMANEVKIHTKNSLFGIIVTKVTNK